MTPQHVKPAARFDKGETLGQLECEFCEEIITGMPPRPVRAAYGVVRRLESVGTRFFKGPSVSPQRIGHSLLIPTQHLTSLAQCSRTIIDEIIQIIANEFGATGVLVYEHGIGRGRSGGCGISHAHMHFLPVTDSEIERIEKILMQRDDLRIRRCRSLGDAYEMLPATASYLMVHVRTNSSDSSTWTHVGDLPSQFMRRVVAETLGSSAWDWRQYSGRPEFLATLGS